LNRLVQLEYDAPIERQRLCVAAHRYLSRQHEAAGCWCSQAHPSHEGVDLRWPGPDGSGQAAVETYQITGMPHGQPVAPSAEQCGHAGTYDLDRGICAAYHLGLFWGLAT
jgi:poly(3-hydroxybutyrate) depolymerase